MEFDTFGHIFFQGWFNIFVVIVLVEFQLKVHFYFIEWECLLGLQYQLQFIERALWGIFAHLQHEHLHSQNSLGGGTIM